MTTFPTILDIKIVLARFVNETNVLRIAVVVIIIYAILKFMDCEKFVCLKHVFFRYRYVPELNT